LRLRGIEQDPRRTGLLRVLRMMGAEIGVEETPDGLDIEGGALQGGEVDSRGDHRIAMAFAVAGQVASGEVRIRDVANVATSFPGFDAMARGAGFGLA
jgi:3-phosphoshikimate 1-carboxyvinyltransferase